jgi:hypothetical protein
MVTGIIASLFELTGSGNCFGDSGAAATKDGRIVGTVSGGFNPNGGCGPNTLALLTDMQVLGNVEFIRTYVPDAIFE